MKIPKIVFDKSKLNKSLQDIANAIAFSIRKNTREGKDMNDAQFAPYSEDYVKYKTKYMAKGKKVVKAAGANPSHVNLMLTGKMMHSTSTSSMKVAKQGNHYMIYFPDKNRALIAYAHHTGTGQKKRAFFGVSASKEKAIYQKYMQQVGRFA